MYINILVLHGNTCFICAMVKLECLEQMIQLQRYVSEMDFFVQEWHPCKGYGPVIQQSKMVSNFLQMDVKVYRLSRFPLIIPFEGYKTMACV